MGADNCNQFFQLRYLFCVNGLVSQYQYMMRQSAAVFAVGPFTQKVEHLRKGKSKNKVVGCVGVVDDEESSSFPVDHMVRLHFVITHNLPELSNIKGSKCCSPGNQDTFGGLAAGELKPGYAS